MIQISSSRLCLWTLCPTFCTFYWQVALWSPY